MTKSNTAKGRDEAKPVMAMAVKGETETDTLSRVLTEPFWRHGMVAKGIIDKSLGKVPGTPAFDDYGRALQVSAGKAAGGDLKFAIEMLTAQANSLDAMFAEFARRAALFFFDDTTTTESYSRIALRAQANCRATLEALIHLHQPREQTVKHVHVNEGGQAVVADHLHVGGKKNGKSDEQSHATGATGDCAALPRPDPEGNGVPIPSREGEAAMQNARRDEPGSA